MKTVLTTAAAMVSAALSLSVMPAAHAAPEGTTPTSLEASVPAVADGADVVVRGALTDPATGAGVEGATLTLFRGLPDDDVPDQAVATGSTDPAGLADLAATADRTRPYSHYYARFDGNETLAAATSPAGRVRNAGVVAQTATTLELPSSAVLRRPVTLKATVTGAGDPEAGGTVRFERMSGTEWVTVADAGVSAAGQATATARVTSSPTILRARYLGADGYAESTSAEQTLVASKQTGKVTISAPASIVDERHLTVKAYARTQHERLSGALVSFQYFKDKKWRTYKRVRTNGDGIAAATSTPRYTYYYRAVVSSNPWHTSDVSPSQRVKNLPPGKVIHRLKGSPKPTSLPAQARTSGAGANATVSRISDAVWQSMKGRSYRSGCPVGRGSLRVVRVNYWGFDGYRHRGELVVHRKITGKTTRAFTELYKNKVSLRAIYRVDRFGYSSRVRGANDYKSMASDNTSAFNCRNVVGRPGVRSPHAYGRSIDINPFENPYRSPADGWVPNTWWHTRAAGTYAWTKKSHLVPRIMRRHGFRWTHGNADSQHFDG